MVVPESTKNPGDSLIELKQEEPTNDDLLQVKQEMAKLHASFADANAKLHLKVDKLEREVSRLRSRGHASELLSMREVAQYQSPPACPVGKVPVCEAQSEPLRASCS